MAAIVLPSTTAESVELKVQNLIFPRRVRLLEFLRTFDPLNHGIITRQQFIRALDQCGVALGVEEMRLLCHAYSDQTAEGVRYRDFSESIERVFRISKAERNPQQFHPLPGASLPPRFTPKPLTEDKQAVLEDILRRLALLAKTRGIIFKYCYQTFDHLHSGFVSPPTFRRNFPFTGCEGKFTEDEIVLLADYFTSQNGKGVNYLRIHELVTERSADMKAPFAVSPYDPRPSTRRWSHEEIQVEQKIQAFTALKQLPLRDFFKDVDRMRKGCCTRTQARATFTSLLNISLNDEEWNYLLGKYTNDEGMFVYAALCDMVERVFTREDLDKHPLVRINMPGRAELQPAQRSWICRSRREEEKIDEIEAALRRKVEQTRKAIKPLFQDFDRQRTMHITRLQFARVMSMLNMPLTEEDLDMLCLRYCDKGNHKEFNYSSFVQSVDTALKAHGVPAHRTITNTKGSVYFTSRGDVVPFEEGIKLKEAVVPL